MAWLVLGAALLLLFVTAWIVVPGWTYSLLALAVAAPEVCAWLLAGSTVVCLLAATLSGSRLSQIAVVAALVSAALAASPLVRTPSTIRRFDAEMERAFGHDYLKAVPAPVQRSLRTHAVVAADLVRGIDIGDAAVVRGIPLGTPDGQALTLTVYRPQGAGPFPTVVQIYGGAWQRGSPDDNPECARYLASRGYAVFAIDYRHAPRWSWPAQMTDVHTGLDWVRVHGAEYGADVSRLVTMGRSAGAHLALLAAYDPAGPPVRGAVSYYGPVDLEDGYRNPPRPDPMDVRAIEEAFLAGTPDSVPGRYREASPLSYVTRRLPPTLLVYGGRDHVVEARFGRILHERLLAHGTSSALLEIPWAEHAFDVLPSGLSAQIALYYTERFLAWALY